MYDFRCTMWGTVKSWVKLLNFIDSVAEIRRWTERFEAKYIVNRTSNIVHSLAGSLHF